MPPDAKNKGAQSRDDKTSWEVRFELRTYLQFSAFTLLIASPRGVEDPAAPHTLPELRRPRL